MVIRGLEIDVPIRLTRAFPLISLNSLDLDPGSLPPTEGIGSAGEPQKSGEQHSRLLALQSLQLTFSQIIVIQLLFQNVVDGSHFLGTEKEGEERGLG